MQYSTLDPEGVRREGNRAALADLRRCAIALTENYTSMIDLANAMQEEMPLGLLDPAIEMMELAHDDMRDAIASIPEDVG